MTTLKLIAYNQAFECSKAVKGADYIKVYDANHLLIAEFSGITNFDGYSLENGEFSEPELTEIDQIQLALTELAELVVGGVE